MANEAQSDRTDGNGVDPDTVKAQLEAVRDDMARLAGTVAELTADKARAVSGEVSKSVESAATMVRGAGADLSEELRNAVERNPIMAVGVAASVGYLLGALSRR